MNLRNVDIIRWTRPLFTGIVLLIGIHGIVALNKGYEYNGSIYNNEIYHLMIQSVPMDERSPVVASSHIVYFGYLPEWTPNIFYILYLILTITVLIIYNLQSEKKRQQHFDRLSQQLKDFLMRLKIANLANRKN